MDINGLFTICSKYNSICDSVVIGLVGKLTREELNPLVVKQIKAFCSRSWCGHRYAEKFPDGFEPSYKAALSNFPNGYLVLEPEEYRGHKLIRDGNILHVVKETQENDLAVYYNAWSPVETGLDGKYQWRIDYRFSLYDLKTCTYHEIVEKLECLNQEIKPQIIKSKN